MTTGRALGAKNQARRIFADSAARRAASRSAAFTEGFSAWNPATGPLLRLLKAFATLDTLTLSPVSRRTQQLSANFPTPPLQLHTNCIVTGRSGPLAST